MSNNRFYMLTGMVVAITITISLYYANSIYSNMNSADEESVVETCADIFRRNLQFTGKTLNPDLLLSEYDRKGKLIKENIKLNNLAKGKLCIMLISENNCRGCLDQEIALLNKLNIKDKILYVSDSPLHYSNSINYFRTPSYYEFENGELFPGFESMQEMPVLLYVETGRIIASCIVTNYSKSFAREFHEYLKKQLNTDADSTQ